MKKCSNYNSEQYDRYKKFNSLQLTNLKKKIFKNLSKLARLEKIAYHF